MGKTFSLKNGEFVDAQKGLEGYLCPGTNILDNIYNIDTPICISDSELLNDLEIEISSQGE